MSNTYANVQEPTYGTTYRKTVYFDLAKGDNVFRILPPFKSAKWAVYHKVHWGYTNSSGQKKPFGSPEVINFHTKMVEVPDAALNRIKQLEALKAQAKQSGDTATLASVTEALKNYSLDKKWYMNVIDLNGTIGVLKIPHKCKSALDEEIKRLKDSGANPVGIKNGRFFVFRKTGEKLDTVYQVSTYKETIDVPQVGKVEREYVSDLGDAIINRMDSEAKELESLYTTPTAAQVERFVKEGARAVDEVFPARQTSTAAPQTDAPQAEAPQNTVPQGATTTPTQTAAPVQAVPVAAPAQAAPAQAAPVPVIDTHSAQANAEFLKQMGF